MRLTYIFVLIFISLLAHGQYYQPVETYNVDDGLSHSEINYLFQDNRGFLWISTGNGLNKFDGYRFKNYPVNPGDSSSLPADQVIRMFEDTKKNLWVVSPRGLSKYIPSGDNFKTYYLNNIGNSTKIAIRDALIDWKRNNIIVLGEDFIGKLELDDEKTRILEIDSVVLHKLNNTDFLSYNGYYNSFFIYGSNTLLKFDAEKDSVSFIDPVLLKILLRSGGINGIINTIKGECLIYTRNEIFLFKDLNEFVSLNIKNHLHGQEIVKVLQPAPGILHIVTGVSVIEYELASGMASVLFGFSIPFSENMEYKEVLIMDRGIYWIGTNKGLFKFNDHRNFFNEISLKDYFSWNDELASLAFDRRGMLWFGSSNGELVVAEPDPEGKSLRLIDKTSFEGNILKIGKDGSEDRVFIATDEGLFKVSIIGNKIKKQLLLSGKTDNFCNRVDTLWALQNEKIFIVSGENKFQPYQAITVERSDSKVKDMFCTAGSVFFLYSDKVVVYRKPTFSFINLSLKDLKLNIIPENICFLPWNDNELLVGTASGIFVYYLKNEKVLPSYLNLNSLSGPIHSMYKVSDQFLWVTTNNGILRLNKPMNLIRYFDNTDGLSYNSFSDRHMDRSENGLISAGGNNSIVLFNADSIRINTNIPKIEIAEVEIYKKGIISTLNVSGVDTIDIEIGHSHMKFFITALDFWAPSKNAYQYSLVHGNKPDSWVDLGTDNTFYCSIRFKTGLYTLKIKGANNDGIWAPEPRVLMLNVIAPWWRSNIMMISYLVLFILMLYLIILFATSQLRRINRQYRERENIARKVEIQKEELSQKNKNITDSINYAKRIQMALMPSEKLFKKYFPDSFILHLPKDIVSGDFYWINEVDDRIYFAAVDCTGHGVPGAFMSIIGFELFRRITEIEKKKQPAEILKSLNLGFESIFPDIGDIILRDGMDVAFCAVDIKLKMLEFAGAFNPLYLVRENTITELKGDRFSVGLNQAENVVPGQPFYNHVIPLQEGDIIYIFTDGYADQFGGPDGKKYKYRRFRHLLLALHQLPMERQHEFLRRSIMDWKGDLDQVDDILVMGIRVPGQ